ncbi:MAG: hypothetical protein ACR2KX_02925 [Chitinophagaceae bacterium]
MRFFGAGTVENVCAVFSNQNHLQHETNSPTKPIPLDKDVGNERLVRFILKII